VLICGECPCALWVLLWQFPGPGAALHLCTAISQCFRSPRRLFFHLKCPSFCLHFSAMIFSFAPSPPGRNPRYPCIGRSGSESVVTNLCVLCAPCGYSRFWLRLRCFSVFVALLASGERSGTRGPKGSQTGSRNQNGNSIYWILTNDAVVRGRAGRLSQNESESTSNHLVQELAGFLLR
jgi:hypothetical protein